MLSLRRPLPLLATMLLAAGSAGCETFGPHSCDPSAAANMTMSYTGGQTVNGVYSSSSPNGELLYFPNGMHYALAHGLGCAPAWWQSYLSFDRYGTQDGGSLAQAAGDQVIYLGIDCKTIEVANNSCVDYWLLVTAGGAPSTCTCPP